VETRRADWAIDISAKSSAASRRRKRRGVVGPG